MPAEELPLLPFATVAEWRKWLKKNHAKVDAIWIQFYKKASGIATVTYQEALDEALCYGWIDGQAKSIDEVSFRQRFGKRRPRSLWSKINVGKVERLTAEGRMQPAGLAEVEAARADGRWAAAYDSPSTSDAPPEFYAQLELNPKAKAFHATLTKQNRYSISFRIQTAKRPETKQRWIERLIAMLERGETFH